jgi:hypothetical protein
MNAFIVTESFCRVSVKKKSYKMFNLAKNIGKKIWSIWAKFGKCWSIARKSKYAKNVLYCLCKIVAYCFLD